MRKPIYLAMMAITMLLSTTSLKAQTAEEKAMAQRVAKELKESGQLHDYRVGVKYQDGVAWLLGTVQNKQQMETAVRLTKGLDGVSHVVNKLQLAGEGSGQNQNQNGISQASSSRELQEPRVLPRSRTNRPRVSQPRRSRRSNMPLPSRRIGQSRGGPARIQQASAQGVRPASAGMMGGRGMGAMGGMPPQGHVPGGNVRGASHDGAQMPGYAWPSYASQSNYAALSYPKQYSASAWPYIGPFYPYPQVPLGWRKVALEWDDGWWFLDFSDSGSSH